MKSTPPPVDGTVVAMLEPDSDGWYKIRTRGADPRHPHSPRFFGEVYGGMGTCRYPGFHGRQHCRLSQHDCELGCVRHNPNTDETRRDAEMMAESLNDWDGRCRGCAGDLAGLVDQVCPSCSRTLGETFAADQLLELLEQLLAVREGRLPCGHPMSSLDSGRSVATHCRACLEEGRSPPVASAPQTLRGF